MALGLVTAVKEPSKKQSVLEGLIITCDICHSASHFCSCLTFQVPVRISISRKHYIFLNMVGDVGGLGLTTVVRRGGMTIRDRLPFGREAVC